MGAAQCRKHLEQMKGGRWRVRVRVSEEARKKIGKSWLKESLGTDSLTDANRLKWPVIERLRAQIAVAEGRALESAVEAQAEELRRRREAANNQAADFEYAERDWVDTEIAEIAEDLAGPPVSVDPGGMPIYEPERERRAMLFNDIAKGKLTPLRLPEASFRAEKGKNWQGKTWGKFDLIMNELEQWLRSTKGRATLEVVDRRAVGGFISAMLEKHGWAPKTVNGYLSPLRQYWGWLIKRGYSQANPWEGQSVEVPRKRDSERERAFTTEEMQKLLYGKPRQLYMADLVRIAALTGARLGAIIELRVKDCRDGIFVIPPGKKEIQSRRVPIHSALSEIVDRRTAGKAPEDWLFPEVPPLGPGASPKATRHNPASKAFALYAVKVGVRDHREGVRRSLVNFHSFRRWFITEAERAYSVLEAPGFTPVTIKEITGHAVDDIAFGVYKAPASDAQRRACIEAVKLPPPTKP